MLKRKFSIIIVVGKIKYCSQVIKKNWSAGYYVKCGALLKGIFNDGNSTPFYEVTDPVGLHMDVKRFAIFSLDKTVQIWNRRT